MLSVRGGSIPKRVQICRMKRLLLRLHVCGIPDRPTSSTLEPIRLLPSDQTTAAGASSR